MTNEKEKGKEVVAGSLTELKSIRIEEQIISNLQKAIISKNIDAVRKLAKMLGYCETRLSKRHKRLVEDIENLEKLIPSEYKAQVDNLKTRMNIFAADTLNKFNKRKGEVPLELSKPAPNWKTLLYKINKADNELKGWLALEKELDALCIVLIGVEGERDYTTEEKEEIGRRANEILSPLNFCYTRDKFNERIMFSMFWFIVVREILRYVIEEQKVKGNELEETLSFLKEAADYIKEGYYQFEMSGRRIHTENDFKTIADLCAREIRTVKIGAPMENPFQGTDSFTWSSRYLFFNHLINEASSEFRAYIIEMIIRAWNAYTAACKNSGLF